MVNMFFGGRIKLMGILFKINQISVLKLYYSKFIYIQTTKL